MTKIMHLENGMSSKPIGDIGLALILSNPDVSAADYAPKHKDHTLRES